MPRSAPRLQPVLALAGLASIVSLATAQNAPKRPGLDPGSDTNSAETYYRFGMRVIRTDPRRAGDAFYWAAQINPTWAQPLYARRIALVLAADDPFIVNYMEGEKSAHRSKRGASIDSLELRSRMLDPFVVRDLDEELLRRYILAEFQMSLHGPDRVDGSVTSEFMYYLDSYWKTEAPPYMRAVLAQSERRFPEALKYYRDALSENKQEAAEIHLARGQIFYLIGNDDSARVEMQLGLDTLRGRDARDFVYLYESKGVLEHSIGLIDERQGLLDQAREAYARALQEDLSYYPAHVHLGVLAMTDGDTTTALNEMDLAAQIRDDDAWVHTAYASVLTQLGHMDDADRHLHRVTVLAPFYAAPYYALGRLAELAHKPSDAAQQYHAFLARAAVQDQRVADARGRLAALETSATPHQ